MNRMIINPIEALKILLKKNKITQEDIAKELKISQSAISLWITGKRFPQGKNYYKIIEFVNKNCDISAIKVD